MFFTAKSRRRRENLRRFSRKSVDEKKFVKDFYVENGLAYISCNVKSYNDIIDPYSVKGYEWLTEPFVRFVEENANVIPPEYPIVLEICGGRFSEEQRNCIEETIADYFALKLLDNQQNQRSNRGRTLFLLFLALFFAVILYLETKYADLVTLPKPVSEAPFVLFWMALWDAAEHIVLDGSDLQEEKLYAARLASLKVTFQKTFEDAPLEPEEEQKVLEEIFEEVEILPSTQWDQEE
ncbi:MAG: hypothetical protein J5555_05530 [Firmicutes bacterium]|nr:hypothetical protein [Bacillota bacterium]